MPVTTLTDGKMFLSLNSGLEASLALVVQGWKVGPSLQIKGVVFGVDIGERAGGSQSRVSLYCETRVLVAERQENAIVGWREGCLINVISRRDRSMEERLCGLHQKIGQTSTRPSGGSYPGNNPLGSSCLGETMGPEREGATVIISGKGSVSSFSS